MFFSKSNTAKYVPYLYFIATIAYCFITLKTTHYVFAYALLALIIPFLWQIIKPNPQLNFKLGLVIICISSYTILAYLLQILHIVNFVNISPNTVIYIGSFIFLNFYMALWIIKNSFSKSFGF